MARVIHDTNDLELPPACAAGEALWLGRSDVERATGCTEAARPVQGDACMPLPPAAVTASSMVDGDRLDIAAFWPP